MLPNSAGNYQLSAWILKVKMAQLPQLYMQFRNYVLTGEWSNAQRYLISVAVIHVLGDTVFVYHAKWSDIVRSNFGITKSNKE